jgi:hypothetical protein
MASQPLAEVVIAVAQEELPAQWRRYCELVHDSDLLGNHRGDTPEQSARTRLTRRKALEIPDATLARARQRPGVPYPRPLRTRRDQLLSEANVLEDLFRERFLAAGKAGRLKVNGIGANGLPVAYGAELFAIAGLKLDLHRHEITLSPALKIIGVAVEVLVAITPDSETGAAVEPEPAPAKSPPSRLKPFWAEAEKDIMRWLADDGCPADRDGGQAKLETRVADLLTKRGWEASVSAIRRHVRACMTRHRQSTGA